MRWFRLTSLMLVVSLLLVEFFLVETGSWCAALVIAAATEPENWENMLINFLPTVKAVVLSYGRRKNLSLEDQEDLEGDIYEKLISNDYQALRAFDGRSSMKTYLTTLVTRLSIDRHRQQRGRWRPSATAKRLGVHAVAIEELINMRKKPLHEVWHIMSQRADFTLTERETETLCEQLPQRGSNFIKVEIKQSHEAGQGVDLDAISDGRLDPEAEFDRKQSVLTHRRVQNLFAEFSDTLTKHERLLLRMAYEDDLRLSEMVRNLGLTRYKIESSLKTIQLRFRELLLQKGIKEEHLLLEIAD